MRAAPLALLLALAALPAAAQSVKPPPADAPADPPAATAPAPSVPATPAPAPAPATPERTEALAAARDLLQANGALDQAMAAMQQTLQQMAGAVALQSGQPVARVVEIFETVLLPEFRLRLPELGEAMAASWASHLSAADLRELAAFYRSPLGERLKLATGRVTAETMEFGARWGQRVGLEAIEKHRGTLRSRGLKI